MDLMNSIDLKRAISPAAAVVDNTPFVTQILDTQAYTSVALAIAIGALADADATFSVTLDHGEQANLSDAVACTADDLVGTMALASFTYAADDSCRKIGYRMAKRYVRATITPANNTGNAFVAALWVGGPKIKPAANPPV